MSSPKTPAMNSRVSSAAARPAFGHFSWICLATWPRLRTTSPEWNSRKTSLSPRP